MSKGTRRLKEKTKRLKKEQTKHLAQDKFQASIFTDISEGILIDDRYEIIDILSQEGGEADILLCEDTKSDNQKVVVKLYRGNFQPKTEILDELKGIKHEDIIGLLDYNSWNNRFYEVMEHAEGGSLAEHTPFAESDLIETIIPELLNALKYCHDKGIIHRDLKPTNLYYRNRNKTDIVIGDFGISSVIRGELSVRLTTTSRTSEYSAPEVFTGIIGKEVDYYALGITLMYLLTGKSPFIGMDDKRIMFIHVSERIPLPDNCSERFKKLLSGLIIKERKNRWGSDEIEKWLRGEDVNIIEDQLESRKFYYKLDETIEANTIKELARVLYENPKTAKEHVGRGYIARAIENYDQSLALKISGIQESAKSNHVAYIEIIYTLDPTLPYRLDEYHEANEPEELALQIDESSQTWGFGCEQLYNQSILTWLKTTGYKHIVEEWDKVRSKFEDKNKMDQGLEVFLHILKPDLDYPILDVKPNKLNLGGIEKDKTKNVSISITNKGRGNLYGTLELSRKLETVSLSKQTIELNKFKNSKDTINITIDARNAPAGQLFSTNINFNTNAEKSISIPLSFRTIFPFSSVIKECLIWGFSFALYFFILRSIISATGHVDWLNIEFKNYLSWMNVWDDMVDSNFGEGVEFLIIFIFLILLPLGILIWRKVSD